jgi:predicted secreted hydrolase
MAHPRRKGGIRRKPTEKESAPSPGRNDKRVWAAIIATSLILLAVGGWYFISDDTPDNVTFIDRSVHFPKDEGHHNEVLETWTLYLNLNYGSSVLGVSVEYGAQYMTEDADHAFYKSIRITDTGNLTGTAFQYRMVYGSINCSQDGLDLMYRYGDQWDRIYRSDDQAYVYRYKMDYDDATGKVLAMNCTLSAFKNPVLWGAEGKLFMMNYGTLYGYFQSRLVVDGTLAIRNGTAQSVTGMCWLVHNWGWLTNYNQESFFLNFASSYDMMCSRFFVPGDENLGLMYVYNIFPDGRYELTKWTPNAPSYTVLVDSTGDYQQLGATVNYTLDTLRYWLDDEDSTRTRCYGSLWHVTSLERSLDFRIEPTMVKQYLQGNWIGQCRMVGTINPNQNGMGYANLIHRYASDLTIVNISDNRNVLDVPGDPTKVRAQISDSIPVGNVTLKYRVNNGSENLVQMTGDLEEANIWWGVIPGGHPLHTSIDYRVVAVDLAGKKVESDWRNYKVEVIVP